MPSGVSFWRHRAGHVRQSETGSSWSDSSIAPERPAPAREEFAALDDEPDDDAQRAKQLRDRFRGVARQASLDPEDGIEL
ncbi:hypothetical protein E0E05_05785 [Roseitalea porphyridii]|uniref:Uncharacterized protein n=1 Tax=Roseitalea porphyridii TaxID=1852022 RepID=A0A4P6V199_9HYPH|nr:hypothetical protein E0E05_05785 [Roseitalea porphyridii]